MIRAFNLTTQENIWNDTSTGFSISDKSPVIYNGYAYIIDYESMGDIFAFNITTGELIWNSTDNIPDRLNYDAKMGS